MSKFNNKLIGSIYKFLMNSVLQSIHCYPYLSLFPGCEPPVQVLNSFVAQIMIFFVFDPHNSTLFNRTP